MREGEETAAPDSPGKAVGSRKVGQTEIESPVACPAPATEDATLPEEVADEAMLGIGSRAPSRATERETIGRSGGD